MFTNKKPDKKNLIPVLSSDVTLNHVDTKVKIETDYDIDQGIIRAEDTTNNDTVCNSNSHEDIAIDGIKTENDNIKADIMNIRDTTKNNVYRKTNPMQVNDYFKAENGYVINVGFIDTEGTTDNVVENTLTPLAYDCIKTENDYVIDNSIINTDDTKDFNALYRSILPKDVAFNSVKVEIYNVMNLDGGNESEINNYVKSDYLFAGESESGTTQKIQRSIAGVQQVTTVPTNGTHAAVDKRRELVTGNGLLVHDQLSSDSCPYQTNSELQLSAHLKARAASVCYSCDMCSYITAHKDSLRRHIEIQ